MKKNSVFPSEYLKVEDVSGMGEEYTMLEVEMVEFKDPKTQEVSKKPVLWFQGLDKGLILNKTNWNLIATLHGDESDLWLGKKITLGLSEIEAFGKKQDAIRVIGAK